MVDEISLLFLGSGAEINYTLNKLFFYKNFQVSILFVLVLKHPPYRILIQSSLMSLASQLIMEGALDF